MDLELPRELTHSHERDPAKERQAWIEELPEAVATAAELWGLALEPPYQPGGQCAWVAPSGDRVLKVAWRHPEGLHEADGLQVWDGDGAVRLLGSQEHGLSTLLLLERCEPGHQLKRTLSEPEQDLVVADLLRRLWVAPPAGHRFRPLQDMCDYWAREFEAKPARPDAVDPGLAREALSLWRSLPADADREVLLCTDLHGDNILAAQREPWLVVDPKPYVGDPCYDPIQHMLNSDSRLRDEPRELIARMADLCGVDEQRLRLWTFARCVVDDWQGLADVARTLAP